MGMWTTTNQDELALVLKSFSQAACKNYGDHAFEAGYLQSLCVSMLADMPKRKQKEVINDMIRATQRQEKQVVEKMSQNRTFERV